MRQSHRLACWLVAGPVVAGLAFTACQRHSAPRHAEHPAEVQKIEGSDVSRVTLTERAAQRIDLRTDQVREQRVAGAGPPRKVVPYSALIYDPQGRAWVYTSPEPLSFVRHMVDVDYVLGDVAVLKEGPPAGTVVASVGVAELYGTEFKVGH